MYTKHYVYLISLCVLAVFRFVFVSSFSFESNQPNKKYNIKKLKYKTNFHKRDHQHMNVIMNTQILLYYYYQKNIPQK